MAGNHGKKCSLRSKITSKLLFWGVKCVTVASDCSATKREASQGPGVEISTSMSANFYSLLRTWTVLDAAECKVLRIRFFLPFLYKHNKCLSIGSVLRTENIPADRMWSTGSLPKLPHSSDTQRCPWYLPESIYTHNNNTTKDHREIHRKILCCFTLVFALKCIKRVCGNMSVEEAGNQSGAPGLLIMFGKPRSKHWVCTSADLVFQRSRYATRHEGGTGETRWFNILNV